MAENGQTTFVLNCGNSENYVVTPLNVYGPYNSNWPSILNVENTTVYFVQQAGQGLVLEGFNYIANTTQNITVIANSSSCLGAKLTENMVLGAQAEGNNNYTFWVYDVSNTSYVQNFSYVINFASITGIIPHSVNLTSSLPIQSIILTASPNTSFTGLYEFSVNNSKTEYLYNAAEWKFYENLGLNSALFYHQTGLGYWNYEYLTYTGLLPIPQPPTPTPSSGSLISMTLIAFIGLLVFA